MSVYILIVSAPPIPNPIPIPIPNPEQPAVAVAVVVAGHKACTCKLFKGNKEAATKEDPREEKKRGREIDRELQPEGATGVAAAATGAS